MRVTIKQIADITGSSKSAVDRALKGQPGVSPELRERILRAAEEQGYKPNTIARGLRRQKQPMRFIMVAHFGEFDKQVWAGCAAAAKELEDYGLVIETCEASDIDYPDQCEALRRISERDDLAGVLVKPISHPKISEAIDLLAARGLPVVMVNSMLRDSRRLCAFGPNHYQSGRVAGSLMCTALGGRGRVVVFVEKNWFESYSDRFEGFTSAINERTDRIKVLSLHRVVEGAPENYDIAVEIFKKTKEFDAVFSTGSSHPEIAAALKSVGRSDAVMIGYDILRDTEQLIADGVMDFVITQSPFRQGYDAVKTLFQYVMNGEPPAGEVTYIPIRIHERESIKKYIDERNYSK